MNSLKLYYIRYQKRRKIKFLQHALARGDCDRLVDHVCRDLHPSQRPYALYREAVQDLVLSLREELGEVQPTMEETTAAGKASS